MWRKSAFRLTLICLFNVCGIVLAQERGLYEEMMLFSNVINHVRANYMDEIDPPELIRAAIDGVLSHLDPHTVYLDPDRYQFFLQILNGEVCGLGIEFDIIDEVPTVISTVKGSSAGRSPIRTGDMLLQVDDQEVVGLAEPELRLLLSGPKGTKVKLVFKRPDTNREFIVTLERSDIPIRTVSGCMLTSELGYIRINRFSLHTAEEFAKTLKELKRKKMSGLILDLRDNPGGLMQSAVGIADMFIPKGEIILETKGRKEMSCETIYATAGKKESSYPMIIVINEGSASASEVLAGSLQDHDRALILGRTSFGKALIQHEFLLNNGGALLMSVARDYLPSGRQIQRPYWGQKTDVQSKVFKTKGGREVRGGPGIVPDVEIEASPPPTLNVEQIRDSNLLSKFGNQLAIKNRERWRKFESYREKFHVSDEIVDDFVQLLKDSDIDVSSGIENFDYL